MNNTKKLFVIIAVQLLISLIFIIAFQQSFEYKAQLILIHLAMVVALVGFGILFMSILVCSSQFRKWRYFKYVLATIPATGSILLFILYIVDFSVNKMGGRNVTYDVLWLYLFKLNDIDQILPFSVQWIYLFSAIFIAFVIVIFMKLSFVISSGLSDLVLPGSPASLFRDRKRALKTLAVLVLSVVAFSWFLVKYHNAQNVMVWLGEPVSNFAVYWSPIQPNPHRINVAKEDRKIRATYPIGRPFSRKNVVLIIADSMRADHMKVYGYDRQTTPFLTSMLTEKKLMKIKMALATCPETSAGVLSILSSRTFRSLSEYNFKINELLRDQGYKIYYIHSGDQTYYQRVKYFFGQDIDIFFDGNNSAKYSINDDRVIFEGLDRVPDYDGKPAFFYFHIMSTHAVGVRHEEYERYKPAKINVDPKKFMKGEYAPYRDVLINRYDDGILQADSEIKEIFSILERKGYLPEGMVFILSDHGEGLGEHEHYGHDYYLFQEDISIPMLIYDSELPTYANMEFASQIDVAPTIIDRLGLPIPSSWEGKSLLNKNIKEFSFHQTRWGPPFIFTVIYRNGGKIYKYIRWPKKSTSNQSREELYELSSDPSELKNLISIADSELIRLLKEKISE